MEASKKSQAEVEAKLEAAMTRLGESQGAILALESKVSDALREAADLREVLSRSGRSAQDDVRTAKIRDLEGTIASLRAELAGAQEVRNQSAGIRIRN